MGKFRARVFTPLGLVVLLTCVGGALMLDLSAYSLSGCSYADGLCDVEMGDGRLIETPKVSSDLPFNLLFGGFALVPQRAPPAPSGPSRTGLLARPLQGLSRQTPPAVLCCMRLEPRINCCYV